MAFNKGFKKMHAMHVVHMFTVTAWTLQTVALSHPHYVDGETQLLSACH